jgi:hypothetical protein
VGLSSGASGRLRLAPWIFRAGKQVCCSLLAAGTELSFANEVKRIRLWPWNTGTIKHKAAIFREINQGIPRAHHDALEFPDGQIVLLTLLQEGQQATVLQLPAKLERAKAAHLVPTGNKTCRDIDARGSQQHPWRRCDLAYVEPRLSCQRHLSGLKRRSLTRGKDETEMTLSR